ncbi:MAG: DUF1887 family CARF protein [Anaerolineales bacterium]
MLLSLIGEQPLPVLLADRALKPARHVLAHSERTRRVAENLRALLPHAELLPLKDPYHLAGIRLAFEQVYQPGITFNLTGGTKPMAWAGYEAARSQGAQIVYLESEKKQSKLYRLDFSRQQAQQTDEILPGLITLTDYLTAHGLISESHLPAANAQEVALWRFLNEQVDECVNNLKFPAFEIDFLVRRGNQAAVIEAKSGKNKRFGIDQLTTITGREYLGTYTGRIWVVPSLPGRQLQDLAKAYGIQVVPVSIRESSPGKWRLDETSQTRLRAALDDTLGASNLQSAI